MIYSKMVAGTPARTGWMTNHPVDPGFTTGWLVRKLTCETLVLTTKSRVDFATVSGMVMVTDGKSITSFCTVKQYSWRFFAEVNLICEGILTN